MTATVLAMERHAEPRERPPVPRRSRRKWWIGGAVPSVVVIAFVLTVHGRADTVFTRAPRDCSLVTRTMIDAYLPGAGPCTLTDGAVRAGSTGTAASWDTRPPHRQTQVHLAVDLVIVDPDDPDDSSALEFDADQEAGLPTPPPITIVDRHSVDGLGDEAYLCYGVVKDEGWNLMGEAEIIVRVGNAVAFVEYEVERLTAKSNPVSQQDVETVVTAVVKDLIGQLS